MRVIGLTGGIATGKSTVSARLRERGAPIIDADRLAREVIAPGTPGFRSVAARFPEVIVDGAIDRARLGQRVFSHPQDRDALNAIVHPLIQGRVRELTDAYAAAGEKVVIYDAALLIENNVHRSLDGLILVTAPPEVQKARLVARDGLTPEAAALRIASQWPVAQKLPHATWVIDNGAELSATRAQVDRVWQSICGADLR